MENNISNNDSNYRYINILLSNYRAEDRIFTYKIKKDIFVEVGMRVMVPFGKGNRKEEGYIIELDKEINIEPERIKEIFEVPDRFTYFDLEMLNLAKFMARKYCCCLSDAINTFVPQSVRFLKRKEKQVKMVRLKDASIEKIKELEELIVKFKSNKTKQNQGFILEELLIKVNESGDKNQGIELNHLLEKISISKSPIDTLKKQDLIEIYDEYIASDMLDETMLNDNSNAKGEILTPLQESIFNQIVTSPNREFLLKGVTGSGKTEVFIKLADYYIRQGKNVIILVPEIGLTPQMVKRFKESFKRISIMHSKLSATEKLEEWKKVKENKVNIIIGPRSAIFMPTSNIGLIIMDEEHEMTYKSEITPKYKTKEVVRHRASSNNSKVVFASATPSVETYLEAITGRLELALMNERYNKKPMPQIFPIDMKKELDDGNKSMFSRKLVFEINERLKKGEQTLLFLNRRGFSTFVSCRKCGHVMKCEHCNIPYVYHQNTDTLECHYCFEKIKNVTICPVCQSKYIKRFGCGTEKVEVELKKVFPNIRTLRMDADTTSRKNSQEEILEKFKNQEADVLIGTQMIAKGHNFPNVTLVGIVAADIMLNFQDFRAAERTFQLVTQVAGRSGRNDKEGIVVMQTYDPDHYAIRYASRYDYDNFFKEEIMLRKQMKCPPFTYLFYITFVANNENMVIEEISKLASIIKKDMKLESVTQEVLKGENNEDLKFKNLSVEVLGPGPATIAKHKDMYRYQLIIRGNNEEFVRQKMQEAISRYKKESKNSKNIGIQLNYD